MERKKSRYRLSYRGTGYFSPGIMITTYMEGIYDTNVLYAGNRSILDPFGISAKSPKWVGEVLELIEHGSDIRRIVKKLPDNAIIEREGRKIINFEAFFDLEGT